MATIKDAALEYAAAGYRMLPLYPITMDEETGERYCTCWQGHACGSAGKHPIATLAPHAVHSWTTDLDEIRAWPEDINIGFALTDTFCAIDIDDPQIAARLLDPDFALADIAYAAVSGRGLHLYVQCAPTQFGNLYVGKKRIGEVRANDALIVAPPSLHWQGTKYRWLGRSIVDGLPQYHGTGWDYAREMLAPLGLEAQSRKPIEAMPIEYVPVPVLDAPFEPPSEADMLRQLLTGTYPTNDRSDTLYRLGCELWRGAAAVGYPLTSLEVAGVVRRVDAVSYYKFTGRGDADKRYLELAYRSKADTIAEAETIAQATAAVGADATIDLTDASGATALPQQLYAYDPVGGFVIRTPKRPIRLASFEPVLTEVLEVWDGSDEISEDWVVSFRQGSTERVVRLRPGDRKSGVAFRARVGEALPPEMIVEARCWDDLLPGIQHYSGGQYPRRRVYAATGWLPGIDGFLLPGAPGAIMPDGFDLQVTFEDSEAPARLRQYGVGMQPPSAPLESVLEAIYSCALPQVIVPLMAQFFAAPLASLGVGRHIVHLFAKTGSLKTSLSRSLLSLYGDFADGGVDSWTATKNSLQATAHRVRDLPLLLDDYKESSLRRDEVNSVIGFIQNYADGTVRTRLRTDQREQRYLAPRCLIVSTGEDVWDKQQSALARTIIIDLPPGAVFPAELRAVQAFAVDGTIGALGFAWLQWLTSIGQKALYERIAILRQEKWEEAAETALAGEHFRVQSAVASLLAVDQLFQEFVAARAPGFVCTYREIRDPGWREAVASVINRSDDARSLTPYNLVRNAIIEGIAAGQVCLGPRLKESIAVGLPYAETIGWVDDENVYLSENLTFGWYRGRRARQGEAAGFSWQAFVQELRQQHGGSRPSNAKSTYEHGLQRVWQVSREEFLDETGEPDEDLEAAEPFEIMLPPADEA